MNGVGVMLMTLAGGLSVAMGVFGIAHIERTWLRWAALMGYVLLIVAICVGIPILLSYTL
jgi:hypothetical protein